jgi:3-phenylpropionate/cinnamic acid dioxygenase small subunit
MLTSTDEREILNLLFRYAELVDAGDFDGVSALFDGAEVFMGGPDRPAVPGAMVGRVMKKFVVLHDGSPHTKHVVTNTIVEADDGTHASTRSYFTVTQCVPGRFPLQMVASGRYHDRFEKTDRWRFVRRTMLVDHHGDTSYHLRAGTGDGS